MDLKKIYQNKLLVNLYLNLLAQYNIKLINIDLTNNAILLTSLSDFKKIIFKPKVVAISGDQMTLRYDLNRLVHD